MTSYSEATTVKLLLLLLLLLYYYIFYVLNCLHCFFGKPVSSFPYPINRALYAAHYLASI